ncbi:MAG: hypothetical protein ACRCUT_12175, partial [Spirochaetota bacterium]
MPDPCSELVRQFEKIVRDGTITKEKLRAEYSRLCARYRSAALANCEISAENQRLHMTLASAEKTIQDQQTQILLADKALTD